MKLHRVRCNFYLVIQEKERKGLQDKLSDYVSYFINMKNKKIITMLGKQKFGCFVGVPFTFQLVIKCVFGIQPKTRPLDTTCLISIKTGHNKSVTRNH